MIDTNVSQQGRGELPKVELGRTGKSLTRYALGGFHQVEISSEIVEQVVDAYLSSGGNYIETARSYGNGSSEEKIGRALQGRRDQVMLCSKTTAETADDARRELEQSLDLLKTDHIEFYLLHCVKPEKLDRIAGKGGAAEGLAKAVDEGILDGVGLSSHWVQVYLDAMERLDLSLILVWFSYLENLNYPIIPERIVPEARGRGIGVAGMKPLSDGFLYRTVENAIRYALAGTDVVVCGTNTVEHVEQVAAAVRKGPADQALQQETLREAVDLGKYVCRRCARCPVPLMETFRLEGVFDRQMIDLLPHDPADLALRKVLSKWFAGSQQACEEFAASGWDVDALLASAAEVRCPYRIDVPRKARIATTKLTGQPVGTL